MGDFVMSIIKALGTQWPSAAPQAIMYDSSFDGIHYEITHLLTYK